MYQMIINEKKKYPFILSYTFIWRSPSPSDSDFLDFLQSGQSYWTVTRLELLLGETGKRVCLHMPCVACCELCDLCEPDT